MRLLLISLLFTTGTWAQSLALVHARIYTDPGSAAIPDGTVVVRDGWISAVGTAAQITVPANTPTIDCRGLTVVAGLWNNDIHLTEPKWRDARSQPAARLAAELAAMFTRHGFTSVFDTGSLTDNTLALRERIRKGEVAGPMILTTGIGLAPVGGTPADLQPQRLPEANSADQARAFVDEHFLEGTDGIKIFTGSSISKDQTATMPEAIVEAVTTEAHRYGLPVLAHASGEAALREAIQGGVDILLDAPEIPAAVSQETLAGMKARDMALIPTLTLFRGSPNLPAILEQVKNYADLGGDILFGTGAGHLKLGEPRDGYELLAKAGLNFRQILASLTITPARRFGYADRKGKVSQGLEADLTVLEGDPATSIEAWSAIRYCIRLGKILYAAPAGP
ncbi:MAG TPA: amidohydrolase family protein [Bryobacteraceae bacterium]|nr:amidohydrolase family protein [Bryobacteraceae bacterium]